MFTYIRPPVCLSYSQAIPSSLLWQAKLVGYYSLLPRNYLSIVTHMSITSVVAQDWALWLEEVRVWRICSPPRHLAVSHSPFFPPYFVLMPSALNPGDVERKILENISFTPLNCKSLPSSRYCYPTGSSTECWAACYLLFTAFTLKAFSSGFFWSQMAENQTSSIIIIKWITLCSVSEAQCFYVSYVNEKFLSQAQFS